MNQIQKWFMVCWIPCLCFILLNCFIRYGQPLVVYISSSKTAVVGVWDYDVIVFPLVLGLFVTLIMYFSLSEKEERYIGRKELKKFG